ncbi:iron-containing alcohol dehydrogenase [Weissella oryzae]|nr:iron-containing alcohol dehydrogenase [Weissella oryzae]
MNDFTFQNTTDLRFGRNLIEDQLRDVITGFGNKVLFVYGGGSIKRSGLYDQVMRLLAGMDVIELAGVEPNPKIESVRAGQELAKQHDIDVILAIGGGSVIDAAKVIGSAKFYDGDPWDLVEDSAKRQTIGQVPLVDILTLSATGTEMNKGSVISNMAENKKLGTMGPNTPAVSFLDPANTLTVSKWQTAAGSIDIFSHLTEQYFDRAYTPVTDNMIEGLMRTVIANAPIALAHPDDYNARGALMFTSTTALNGLVSSGNENGWTVHPIEHELSAYYDITHGVGLGILTPRWMKQVLDETSQAKFAKLARNVWDIHEDDDMLAAKQAIQATYDWVKSLDVPTVLQDVNIPDNSNFQAMAESAVAVGNLDKVAYKKLTPADVVELFEASMTTEGFE